MPPTWWLEGREPAPHEVGAVGPTSRPAPSASPVRSRRGASRPVRGHVPTRDPRGAEVRWWERPVPADARDPEACLMARELHRLLHATGRTNVSALARACAAAGRPHDRATISRVLNGTQPASRELVEDLALAAGIDLAYLVPDRAA